jgi:hypothetical protein
LTTDRLAERVSAASYGTVLVLAALAAIDSAAVESGWGWELMVGVGLTTWAAHLYAEIVADHLHHTAAHSGQEIKRAMTDGSPILLAALLPGVLLALGRVDTISDGFALGAAMGVALLQLVGLGVYVGSAVDSRPATRWVYACVTAAFGLAVVALKLVLGH